MNEKSIPEKGAPRKVWRVLAFKRRVPEPIERTLANRSVEILDAMYLVREELGEIVLAPGYSNDEVIFRRLLDLSQIRGVRLHLEIVDVKDINHKGQTIAQVTIPSATDEHGDRRFYSSICPFCDEEIKYNGLVINRTEASPGEIDVLGPDRTCRHFSYLDVDPDLAIYVGDFLELGGCSRNNDDGLFSKVGPK